MYESKILSKSLSFNFDAIYVFTETGGFSLYHSFSKSLNNSSYSSPYPPMYLPLCSSIGILGAHHPTINSYLNPLIKLISKFSFFTIHSGTTDTTYYKSQILVDL